MTLYEMRASTNVGVVKGWVKGWRFRGGERLFGGVGGCEELQLLLDQRLGQS